MPDPHETARELATHAADIRHLHENTDRIARDMDDIKRQLADIQRTLSEAKGGWRILMLLGGASGILGAMIPGLLKRLFP